MMSRICILEQADERAPDSVMPRLIGRLGERGCTVDVLVPERAPATLATLAPDVDVYVWKSHGRLSNSIAAYLHACGRTLINSYFATLQVRDKIVTAQRLIDAGVPTPQAYYADSVDQIRSLVPGYPIVVKPNGGRRGEQIAVVRDARDLDELPASAGPFLAQRYVQGNGLDLKAYVIGDQVFGVWRPFPARTAAEKRGQRCALSQEIREICLRCGRLFGLELYGVDIIETDDGPMVIEVNCFPGYRGVPGADSLIADHIVRTAESVRARTRAGG